MSQDEDREGLLDFWRQLKVGYKLIVTLVGAAGTLLPAYNWFEARRAALDTRLNAIDQTLGFDDPELKTAAHRRAALRDILQVDELENKQLVCEGAIRTLVKRSVYAKVYAGIKDKEAARGRATEAANEFDTRTAKWPCTPEVAKENMAGCMSPTEAEAEVLEQFQGPR